MNELSEILIRQLHNLFGLADREKEIVEGAVAEAVSLTRESLSAFDSKYYDKEINPFNSVVYTNFLYWCSRLCFEMCGGDRCLADKIYYLNKTLNNVELFYEVALPKHWSCEHPLGSVMGRAKYGDRFFFYQGCTVGGNPSRDGINYPVIGDNVRMYSNSKILGNCRIGNNVIFSANAYCINETVLDNVIVFGQSPHILLKERTDMGFL